MAKKLIIVIFVGLIVSACIMPDSSSEIDILNDTDSSSDDGNSSDDNGDFGFLINAALIA